MNKWCKQCIMKRGFTYDFGIGVYHKCCEDPKKLNLGKPKCFHGTDPSTTYEWIKRYFFITLLNRR